MPRSSAKLEGVSPVVSAAKRARPNKTCMLLYSWSGVGKTRFIGGGPRTLIIRPPTDHTDSIRSGDAEEKVVHDWDDLNGVYEYFRQGGAADWDWAWLDSASLFQDHGLDDIWQNVIDDKPARAKHGLDKGEYGVNMHRLGLWVRHMVGLPGFNFGMTAHPMEMIDPVTGDLILMPYIQGKNMPNKMCGYMNIVAYMRVTEKKRRVLHTSATEHYYAKDQYDCLPDGKMLDPTMPKLIAAINKSRGAATTTRPRRTRRAATRTRSDAS